MGLMGKHLLRYVQMVRTTTAPSKTGRQIACRKCEHLWLSNLGHRFYCSTQSATRTESTPKTVKIGGECFKADNWTNVTPRIINKLGKNLHNMKNHPLNLIRLRIQNHFYATYLNRSGNPLFSVYDNISPIVSLYQNFDSLLVPADHVSRNKSDSYYINRELLLRAHTTAHQQDLIKMGLDAFLIFGDVYRRDEIDSTHYPVFHQMDAVRLFNHHQVFSKVNDSTDLHLFEKGKRGMDKQELHTLEATKLVEHDLKQTLLELAKKLFGKSLQYRWVDCYFPFTHPSWELEILHEEEWLEVLGCGIIEQEILHNAGAGEKIGWAFGLGLERLAMHLYQIPDIRLFWSEDQAFLEQFNVKNPDTPITFKPFSNFMPCVNNISFWIPETYNSNDFYDLVRVVGEDLVERVELIDTFVHPKHGRTSHCYRITYRHMDKVLTNEEVNQVHIQIEAAATGNLGVEIR